MSLVDGIDQLGQGNPRETAPAFEDAARRPQRPVPAAVLHGHQSGDGTAVAGDGQTLASQDPLQKPGQAGSGLMGANAFHSNPFRTRRFGQV